MKSFLKFSSRLFIMAFLLGFLTAVAWSDQGQKSRDAKVMTLRFGGGEYLHRWSKKGQNEFTPRGQSDLSAWHDMLTLNLHEQITNGDKLASLANRILGLYQKHGKIIKTASKPRTADRTAEHLIVAVMGNPGFLEAVFARILLKEGRAVVAVYSHRIYGKSPGPAMGEWLKSNGQKAEKVLMAWDKVPSPAAIRQLPQSK